MPVRWVLAALLAGLLGLVGLTGCGQAGPGVGGSGQGTSDAAAPEGEATAMEATPSASASVSPVATATTTVTPTPTATALTRGAEVLAAENAGQVEELRRWGAGEIERAFLGLGGKYLAIETKTGAYIRERSSLALQAEIPGALDTAVSEDLRHLAVSFLDGHIEFWDLEKAKLAASIPHEVEWPKYPPADFDREAFVRPQKLVFSPDSDHVAVAYGNGDVELLSALHGTRESVLRSEVAPFPTRILFTPDGKYLLSLDEPGYKFDTSDAGHAAFWDVGTGELVSALRIPQWVTEYPFSPDGTRMLVSRWGGRVEVLGVPYGEEVLHFGTGLYWAQVAYSKEGDYYLVAGVSQVRAVEDGKLVERVDYSSVAQDHSYGTAVSNREAGQAGSFSGLFDLRTTAEGGLEAWALGGSTVTRLSIFDEKSKAVDLPGVEQGEAWPRGHMKRVDRVRLSDDGSRIGSCTAKELFVIDIATDRVFSLPGCMYVGDFSFTPDGEAVWVSNEGEEGRWSAVKQFAVADGKLLHTITLHTDVAQTMEYLGNGSKLLTSSQTKWGGETYLWDAEPLAKITALKDIHDRILVADMTPDGNYLVVVDSVVRIFDLRSLSQIKIIPGDTTAMAIAPDGTMLAIGGADGSITLVTLPRGEELAVLNGHQGEIADLVFAEDMKALYSASGDGTVRLWGVPSSTMGGPEVGGQPAGTPLPQVTVATYDSFDDARYEGGYNLDLWILRNPSLGTAVQEQGVMVLQKDHPAGDLLLDALGTWTYEGGYSVQADIMLDEGRHDGVIRLVAGGDIGPDQWFAASCVLNPDAYLSCFFDAETSGAVTDQYESPGAAFAYDTWHTVRIEIDPPHEVVRYFIDGELIGSHTPSEHAAILGSPMHFFMSVYGGPITGYTDNVAAGRSGE